MFHTRVLPFLLLIALSAASHAVPISFKSCNSLCGIAGMNKGSKATTPGTLNEIHKAGGVNYAVSNHTSSVIRFSQPSPVLTQLFLNIGKATSKSFNPNHLRSLRIHRSFTNIGLSFDKRTNSATNNAGDGRSISGKGFKFGAAIPVPEPSSMLLTAAGLLGLRILRDNGRKA